MSSHSPTPSVSPEPHAHEPQARAGVERAAAWLSAACAVHCLAVPVASALVPFVGASSSTMFDGVDPFLSVLVVVGGTLSALFGYRRHRDARLSALMIACVLVYLVGHALEGAWYGSALAVLAGIGLSVASFFSARLSHVHGDHCAH